MATSQPAKMVPRARLTTLLFAMIVVVAVPGTDAAAQEESQFQTWTDWTSILSLGEKWQYDGDYGLRGIIAPDDWNLVYGRPSVRYRVNPWLSLHGGVGAFYLWDELEVDAFELRPWQGVLARGPQFGRWWFSHYVRLEERLIWITSADDFDASLRLRYRFELNTPSWRIGQGVKTVYGSVSLELFGDPGGGFSELYRSRSRLTLVLGHRLDPRWRVELHYIRQGTEGTIIEGFELTEHILRLRIKTELD